MKRRTLVLLLMCVSPLLAKTRPRALPQTPVRKYFWAARDAFENGQFKKAQEFLQQFRASGSPEDPLLKQLGCNTREEAKQFSALVQSALKCSAQKTRAAWRSGEQAKVDILRAFKEDTPESILPYLDCGPVDLTAQTDSCSTRHYPAASDFTKLVHEIHKRKAIYKRPYWRDYRPDNEGKTPHWIHYRLYTYIESWQPCGMPAAPILSLRETTKGEIRIAGFAASCVDE